jgi:phosphatidyl-myo-inositol dimannoside synthase
MILLVATEMRFIVGPDGRIRASAGVGGYSFWRRYTEVFDDVVVAARTRTGKGELKTEPVEGPGVRIARLPDYRGPWQYMRVYRALVTAVAAAVSRAHVLCLRAPGQIAGLTWRVRGPRRVGVEVVGDPLDSLGRGAVRSSLRPFARAVMARRLRQMCRDAHAVAYVTEAALQRRYPTRAWKTSYSSIELEGDGFVDESAIESRANDPRRAGRGTDGNPWRLVLVGSLANRNKGVDIAIQALAMCRRRGLQASLQVVGDGVERLGCERQARHEGVDAWVRFLGQLPSRRAVRDVVDTADLFVLPSRAEGLPRAMLEAMARAIPCVGSSVGGIPEILPKARCVRAGNANQLAEVISRLLVSRDEMVASARSDRLTALRYRAAALRPKRRAFYERLRSADALGELPGACS